MKFIINETGETKELNIFDSNNINWTQDLIGNTGAVGDTIIYDEEKEAYKISMDDFTWWQDYIADSQSDAEKLAELKEEYDEDEIQNIINEEMSGINDYDENHAAMENAFDRIRNELDSLI